MRIVFRDIHAGEPRLAPTAKEETHCTGEPVARPLLLQNARQILHDLLAFSEDTEFKFLFWNFPLNPLLELGSLAAKLLINFLLDQKFCDNMSRSL